MTERKPCGTCGAVELNMECGVCRSLNTLMQDRKPEPRKKRSDKEEV